MERAADNTQRSSSPLKRRASALERDTGPGHSDDDGDSKIQSSHNEFSSEILPVQVTPDEHKNSIDVDQNVTSEPVDQFNTDLPQQKTIQDAPAAEIPDITTRANTIASIIDAESKKPTSEGDKVYLVSQKWLHNVQNRGSEALKAGKQKHGDHICPIDNSDITLQILRDVYGNDFVQLKPGLSLDDFALFPEAAWNLILKWYGMMPGTLPIVRTAHNTNPTGASNTIFEFYPLVFKIHRLFASNNSIVIPQTLRSSNPEIPTFIFSKSTKWIDFLRAVKHHTGIEETKKIRVWRVLKSSPAAESTLFNLDNTTPPSSRPSSPSSFLPLTAPESQDTWKTLLLDVANFLKLEKNVARELLDAEDISINPKYNGSRDLSMVGLCEDQTIVLDEQVCSNDWVSNHISKGSKVVSTAMTRTGTSLNSQGINGRNIPVNSGPMMTRGRAKKAGRTPGTVGLSNLGNTCYMNSALQCIRAVEELSKYFLGGAAMEELNRANPLGNNGDVAIAYQKLLEEIYHKENVPSSVAPRHFKNIIGRYAPSFSGYGQQDSQEFLGFLLDGLQEDLSRVKKKPYIEKPDSTDDMVNNPEAIREMADKVWDITKKRDDSVIADLFTGMYKSTLVCPVCNKVSITFDPFNNLTLQLPIENTWSHNLFYFPLNERPFTMAVEIEKQASMMTLKKFVSSRVGVPVERLLAAEEYKGRFFKLYKDHEVASDAIQTNDNLAIYELEAQPTNWPPPNRLIKKSSSLYSSSETEEIPNWDDPITESMVVSVIHRRPKLDPAARNMNKNARKNWSVDCAPHFIVLTPDEARDGDVIKRKILEKVATYSTSSAFIEGDDNSKIEDGVDSDLVITNYSDTNSGDSNIIAESVTSEEDVVDITMNDAVGGVEIPKSNPSVGLDQSQINQKYKSAPFKSNSCRPKFVNSSSFLRQDLQNMFEIGYYRSMNEITPSSWNTIKEDEIYPPISSRISQIKTTRINGVKADDDDENGDDNDNDDDDDDDNDNGSGSGSGNGITGSDTSEGGSNSFCNTTHTNEGSESEDELTHTKDLPVRIAGSKTTFSKVGAKRSRLHQQKAYHRKGRQQKTRRCSSERCNQERSDNGPLVRPGEILVVDWNYQAFDLMFGGDGKDSRGQSTWKNIPTREDDALLSKRKISSQRKKNGITLDDCLDEFGKEEILSEMDTWYCPRCREHRRASKKFELWMTPDILVMHLKRFSSSARRRDKLDIRVDFPIEGLDLSSRVVKQNESNKEIYDLFAVDNHWGGLGGGHYTAYAKNFYDGEWYEYNDSSVSKQKNLSDLVSSSAYLLFYRRRSQFPLGGPRFQQIIQDYDSRNSRSEDERYERGEDQALVGNSSFLGSSSALAGVGAAHHPPDGFDSEKIGKNQPDIEPLPTYAIHENDEDTPGLLGSDNKINLREDIEDEGFAEANDISYENFSYVKNNSYPGGTSDNEWNFSGLNNSRGDLPSGTGSDDEISSERVQCDSCPSQTSLRKRLLDFEDSSAKDDDGFFGDNAGLTHIDEDKQELNISLQHDLERMNRRSSDSQEPRYVIGDMDILDVEDIATDIHLEDAGESNME